MSTLTRVRLCLVLAMLLPAAAFAWEIDIWENRPIDVHGIAGQGFIYSTNDNYMTFNSTSGDFEWNELLLNARLQLSDSWSVQAQVISRDFGYMANNRLELDWAYLDYAYRDWLGLRLGRVKIPWGLYGEYTDIDMSRTNVVLPQPIYLAAFRDLFTHADGVNLYGSLSLGKAGSLDYTGYFGNLDVHKDGGLREFVENDGTIRSPHHWSSDYCWGLGLTWNTPVDGLRVNATINEWQNIHSQHVDILRFPQVMSALPGRPAMGVVGPPRLAGDLAFTFTPWTLGLEYTKGNLVMTAEMIRGDLYQSMSNFLIKSNGNFMGYYVQADYRWTDKWATALNAGQISAVGTHDFPHETAGVSMGNFVSAAVRYDITDYWLAKLEITYIDGGGGTLADIQLRNNLDWKGFDDRSRNRWNFMARTTLYF